MLSMKDKLQLQKWFASKASLKEVQETSRYGLVENERFSERAREVFIFLWFWSAPRFSDWCGYSQSVIYKKRGMEALYRRYARANRIIDRIIEGKF